MRHREYTEMEYEFNLLQYGCTVCPSGWGMKNTNAIFYRMYYIYGGEACYRTEEGVVPYGRIRRRTMLHDPSHRPVIPEEKEIQLTQKDKDILKFLGEKTAEISGDRINLVNARNWTILNDKKRVKPMVWINEVPWHEMNVDEELTLCCEHTWARSLEETLRRQIYQWNHFRGDMVVNPYIECPLAIHSTDFGILEEVDIAYTDQENDIYSRHFKIQIKEPEDIEKIKMPVVTHYEKATEYSYQAMQEIFDGIIPVKKVGQTHIWYTPWDFLIRWWGVEEAMMDLMVRPEMVHAFYEKMVQAWMTELDQLEEQNLLSLDCGNTRVGSGGYGYTSGLPGAEFDENHVTAKNMWGCANAQIFASVSPDMHWEFAIEHDLKWLKRFGMTYYGCCEPLDNKIHLLRRIPNLRKVSVSPWNKSAKILDALGTDYVISRKPNPAVVALDLFDPQQAEKEIREFMDFTTRDQQVELIFKDISTVRHQPRRLWKWEKTAMRTAEDYA